MPFCKPPPGNAARLEQQFCGISESWFLLETLQPEAWHLLRRQAQPLGRRYYKEKKREKREERRRSKERAWSVCEKKGRVAPTPALLPGEAATHSSLSLPDIRDEKRQCKSNSNAKSNFFSPLLLGR